MAGNGRAMAGHIGSWMADGFRAPRRRKVTSRLTSVPTIRWPARQFVETSPRSTDESLRLENSPPAHLECPWHPTQRACRFGSRCLAAVPIKPCRCSHPQLARDQPRPQRHRQVDVPTRAPFPQRLLGRHALIIFAKGKELPPSGRCENIWAAGDSDQSAHSLRMYFVLSAAPAVVRPNR